MCTAVEIRVEAFLHVGFTHNYLDIQLPFHRGDRRERKSLRHIFSPSLRFSEIYIGTQFSRRGALSVLFDEH